MKTRTAVLVVLFLALFGLGLLSTRLFGDPDLAQLITMSEHE